MKTAAILERYPEIEKNETYRSLRRRYRRLKAELEGVEGQVKIAKRQYRKLQAKKSVSKKQRKRGKEVYKNAKKIRKQYRYLLMDASLLLKKWLKVYVKEQALMDQRQQLHALVGQKEDRNGEEPAPASRTDRMAQAKPPAAGRRTAPSPKRKGKKTADDLTRIKGIGPKAEQLLKAAGITTFERLSQAHPKDLRELLEKGGPGFRRLNPDSWPAQAREAAKG